MKKLFIIPVCLAVMASCDVKQSDADKASHERDSLMQIISQKDEELNDIVGSINEVQEGFRRINEAEERVTITDGSLEGASSKQAIRENMEYIENAMKQNRELIAQLQQKLKKSSFNAEALQKTIENLQAQLDEQNAKVQELQAQLAERDATIAQQGEQIGNLNENVNQLNKENESKAQKISAQDKDLNKAWFVFGTKRELKEQKILQDGDVLKKENYNKDYFTEIDIRQVKEIKFYSKNVKLLTTHPSGYTLEKDSKGEYVLKITNYTKFWSVSKYMVALVK